MNLFVWDFHGVLEKDNEIALAEQINFILEKYGFERRVSVAETFSLSGKHYRQIFFELCPGITVDQAKEMGDLGVSTGIEFARRSLKPREHAKEVLTEIRAKGDKSIVASNCAPPALEAFVEMVGLQDLFDALLPVVSEHVNPETFSILDYKLQRIREFIGDKKFDRVKCIGDKERDIDLGQKLGAETYLFDPNNLIKETKADHTISDLRDVL